MPRVTLVFLPSGDLGAGVSVRGEDRGGSLAALVSLAAAQDLALAARMPELLLRIALPTELRFVAAAASAPSP